MKEQKRRGEGERKRALQVSAFVECIQSAHTLLQPLALRTGLVNRWEIQVVIVLFKPITPGEKNAWIDRYTRARPLAHALHLTRPYRIR